MVLSLEIPSSPALERQQCTVGWVGRNKTCGDKTERHSAYGGMIRNIARTIEMVQCTTQQMLRCESETYSEESRMPDAFQRSKSQLGIGVLARSRGGRT